MVQAVLQDCRFAFDLDSRNAMWGAALHLAAGALSDSVSKSRAQDVVWELAAADSQESGLVCRNSAGVNRIMTVLFFQGRRGALQAAALQEAGGKGAGCRHPAATGRGTPARWPRRWA